MLIGKTKMCGCTKCGETKIRYINIADFYSGDSLCKCGGTLIEPLPDAKHSKTFSSNILIDQTLGYYDNQLGAYVESTSDRRRICKAKGLIPISPGEQRSIKSKVPTDEQRKQEIKQQIKDAAYKNNIPLPGVS